MSLYSNHTRIFDGTESYSINPYYPNEIIQKYQKKIQINHSLEYFVNMNSCNNYLQIFQYDKVEEKQNQDIITILLESNENKGNKKPQKKYSQNLSIVNDSSFTYPDTKDKIENKDNKINNIINNTPFYQSIINKELKQQKQYK